MQYRQPHDRRQLCPSYNHPANSPAAGSDRFLFVGNPGQSHPGFAGQMNRQSLRRGSAVTHTHYEAWIPLLFMKDANPASLFLGCTLRSLRSEIVHFFLPDFPRPDPELLILFCFFALVKSLGVVNAPESSPRTLVAPRSRQCRITWLQQMRERSLYRYFRCITRAPAPNGGRDGARGQSYLQKQVFSRAVSLKK